MPRAKIGAASKRRKKRILKAAKGYRGGRGRLLRTASETLLRAMAYATRDRYVKKRTIRRLWITRLNAAARERGLTYSHFVQGLKKANIVIDRKILSDMAVNDPTGFDAVFEMARGALE